MKSIFNYALATLIFTFCSLSLADTYFVMPTTGAGLSGDDAAAVTELIRSSVNEGGSHQVVNDVKAAKYVLQPRVVRLGGSYVMTVEKLQGSKLIFSSQLKAAHVEELDGVAARITRAVVEESPAKGDARINDVTETEETAGLRRREARKHWFLGFGPYGASNLGTQGTNYDLGIAYAWDIYLAQIKIFYEGVLPGSSSSGSVTAPNGANVSVNGMNDFGLALNYYLKDTDIAPFVSGDFGYGSADSVTGFIIGGGAGFGLFRTSTINLEIMARYGVMMNQTALGTPSVYGIRLGLYF